MLSVLTTSPRSDANPTTTKRSKWPSITLHRIAERNVLICFGSGKALIVSCDMVIRITRLQCARKLDSLLTGRVNFSDRTLEERSSLHTTPPLADSLTSLAMSPCSVGARTCKGSLKFIDSCPSFSYTRTLATTPSSLYVIQYSDAGSALCLTTNVPSCEFRSKYSACPFDRFPQNQLTVFKYVVFSSWIREVFT
jgi:hypothetical protein